LKARNSHADKEILFWLFLSSFIALGISNIKNQLSQEQE
jgi:hypothetical protein